VLLGQAKVFYIVPWLIPALEASPGELEMLEQLLRDSDSNPLSLFARCSKIPLLLARLYGFN